MNIRIPLLPQHGGTAFSDSFGAAPPGAFDGAADDDSAPDLPDPPPDPTHQWLEGADARTQAGRAEADLIAEANQRFEEAKSQAAPGAHGLTESVLRDYDQSVAQQHAALPPAAQPTFAAKAAAFRPLFADQALRHEAQARLAWRADEYTLSVNQWAAQVGQNPDLLPLALASLQESLPVVDAGDRQALGSYAHGTLIAAGARSALASDPQGLLDAIDQHGASGAGVRGADATAGAGAPSSSTVATPEGNAGSRSSASDYAGSSAGSRQDAAADNPLVAAMTPSQREQYREQARIAVLQQASLARENLNTRGIL